MPILNDNSEAIGKTPLVKINRLTEGTEATVLAKIEGRNPAYSVKCRIGASMIWDAEKIRASSKPACRLSNRPAETRGSRWRSCVRGARLSADAHHARQHVARTTYDAACVRGQPRDPDSRSRRHERAPSTKPPRSRKTPTTSCPSNFRTPPTRRFTSKPPVPNSGKTPTATSITSSPVWERVAPLRVSVAS